MNVKVRVPLSFQRFTRDKAEFECHGVTLEELLANLVNQYHGIKEMLYDDEGSIRPSLRLFVNGKIVRIIKKEELLLKNGDEIVIMQLIAGG
jgi:sulfur-carrier protein